MSVNDTENGANCGNKAAKKGRAMTRLLNIEKAEVLADFIRRQMEFSRKTFGEGPRTLGVTDHIEKELREIRQDPADVKEWIDVIILAFDGYWRHGGDPAELLPMLEEKFAINRARKWGPITPDKAIEHIRDVSEVEDCEIDDGC